ncbi:FHA domain-containing protein DDL [Eutrema salsugineum]|uniref:FHA domain-containing protein DDL n=1 Tax=Eutrema salsugineum TaxID=72664 RepID=UPI000CED483F|nr:FHA domain-containing protein DDL [Eutrema salsugineum]
MARNVSGASESPVRQRHSPRRRSPSRREEESSGLRDRSSRSPSPRTKRLRRAQGEREAGRSREREDEKHNSRGREKSSSREVEKERDRGKRREQDIRDRDRERRRDGEKEKTRDIKDREVGDMRRRSGREENEERKRAGTDDERQPRGRRERSISPLDRSHKSRRSPESATASRGSGQEPNDEEDSIARMRAAEEALAAKTKKEEPSFELSGKLAEETNRYRGITLLFSEPPEARKPTQRWRLYVFKDGEPLNEPLQLHRQSCYLFGRERRIADIPTDHPSCSKQHAVIQYREVEKEKPDGMMGKEVRPYIMDLGSTNKTYINESPIEPERYYELFEKDTIKFGNSSREYVLLHENSA